MRKISVLLVLAGIVASLSAQTNYQGWRVHLPYVRNNSIAAVGSKLYCGSQSGIFTYNTEDGSVERLSKVNGLSDVEVAIVKHNPQKNCTVIIYENANIDIIDHTQHVIYNIPDVFVKSMIGLKKINQLCFYEDKAYLACSFGIVVLNLQDKRTVADYQKLGPNGTQLDFSSVSIYNNSIIGCSSQGVFAASLDAPNLGDFAYWFKINNQSAQLSAVFNNELYVVLDSVLSVYDGTKWEHRADSDYVVSMQTVNKKLVMAARQKVIVKNDDGTTSYYPGFSFRFDATVDARGYLASVDNMFGLTINRLDHTPPDVDYIWPNGPAARTFGKMTFANGKLWVSGGSVNERWDPLVFNGSKFFTYSDNQWFNYTNENTPLIAGAFDFIDVKKNPFGNDMYISSYGNGVFEIANDAVVKKYDDKNSSLQHLVIPDSTYIPLLSGGIDFDNNGNLWVSNSQVAKPISVKTKNGWKSFGGLNQSITQLSGGKLGWLTCDDYNNKWVTSLLDNGLLVYNDGGTPENENDDSFKMLNKETGQGALPSNSVLCVSKDLQGEMWIGTNEGLTILSNPGIVFNTKSTNFDARQIIIKAGSNYEIFLGKERINCIKVDPANRKWIGTPNGVWLVSPDGYTVIKNFTTSNSPLLSNNVIEVGIDENSGEVFFGTEKGIISYMGDATGGGDGFGKVEIFPNPVRPDFTGDVSVRGLALNARVKFTDIQGNLVYETIANGGYATWNGRSFNGKRVSTGVYLVFAAKVTEQDKEVTSSFVGKILFIN